MTKGPGAVGKSTESKMRSKRVLKRTIILSIVMIILVAIPSYFFNHEITAQRKFKEGKKYYDRGEFEEAIEHWKEIHNDFKGTSVWGETTFYMGEAYWNIGETNKAIPYYQEVLSCDDKNFKAFWDFLDDGHWYSLYYRYWSCIRTSEWNEEQEDFTEALSYAYLARDKYWFHWCGTCGRWDRFDLNKRINRLMLFQNWSRRREELSSISIWINLEAESTNSYSVTLPIPIVKDVSNASIIEPSIALSNITIIEGNVTYEIINTTYGPGLNITSLGGCRLQISYTTTRENEKSDIILYDNFSMQDEDHSDYYWISYTSNNSSELIMNFTGSWIEYPPEWEYEEWVGYYIRLDNGWQSERLLDYGLYQGWL